MARKNLYQGDLLKTDDWGAPMVKDGVEYDAAGGTAVQNFIKKTLDEKWGCVYDNNRGKYYIFADEESRDLYLEHEDDETMDPEIEALKLAEMNSYSNYRILITLDTEQTKPTNAILVGQTGNKVAFVAQTFDNDENPLLEGLTVNYTITRQDGSKSFVTHFTQTDKAEELTIDNYLAEGQNTVTINIVGATSNAIANTTIVFQVINLRVEDNYDISRVHDTSNGNTSSLQITWAVTGSSVSNKFIEWYVDGVLKQADLLAAPSGTDNGRVSESFAIDSVHFTEGRHNIQYRAWITVNDQRFYTRTYYKDFIVYNGGTVPIIAISYSLPIGVEPLTGTTYQQPYFYDAVQYTNFVLPVAVYKNNTSYVNTSVSVKYMDDGVEKTDVSYSNQVSNGEIWNASITPNITGEASIVIEAGDSNPTVYVIGVGVQENSLNIREITAGLRLDLRAAGKSNSASDRDQWVYVDGSNVYETVFNGVTFDETSGWNDNALVLSNGDSIDVKYKPLTTSVKSNGLTFEIEFSTFNVSDDDVVICDMKSDSGNAGLVITASEAKFSDSLSNTVSTKFKSNENYRIAFVVDPVREAKPLILIYVNGALCGGIGYPGNSSEFFVDKTIKIQSSPFAGVKVKHIRIYDEPLNADDILNNYMLYRDTYAEMESIYSRNDLYVSSGVFDFDRIASILPIMFITDYDQERNNIENLMSFGTADKKTPILVRQVIYINNLDPSTSFSVDYAQFTPQGTSSMNYPIKNLRLYIKDKAKGKYGTWPLPITYTADTSSPETMISLSNPYGPNKPSKAGKGKIAFKSGLAGTFSEGERKPQAVNCWTLKADYAESSSSHNTGVARLWNKVMRDAVLGGKYVSRTRAQQTVADSGSNMDVRTSVDGFPCVVFYRYSLDDTNWKFLGKYNFNNDKSTESVFGFCDIPGIGYQEYDYTDCTEQEYDDAYNNNPDDCRYKSTSFTSREVYENTVRKFVGKEIVPGEEPEELTEDDYDEYVKSLCATPYEYSKVYQKAEVFVAGTSERTVYQMKVMTAGNRTNRVHCFEVLENEADITNFTADVSKFDSDWEHGFESRYPEIEGEDENPDAECQGGLTELREFYAWCHSTMNTRDSYDANPTHTVVINGEVMEDGSLIYKQESRTYADNGTYVAADFNDYTNLMKQKFQKEKWDYIDVFKIAAYYIYLMRFGAVDQVCKNSMFTTEGTVSYIQNTTTTGGEGGGTKTVSVQYTQPVDGNHCKWFFINYDNDTILGLNNDGQMAYGPDIDRSTQTGEGYWVEHDHPTQEMIDDADTSFTSIDDLKLAVANGEITPQKGDKFLIGGSVWEWYNESSYAYAGHNSVLWNNLEADDEFMTIVRDMDDAIYRAGLNYNDTIKMFNDKQATMWCEHILNDDAKIKYVNQYTQKNNNHLSKMHGPRTSHRMWWLSKRFTYFDSKFVSGEYMSTKIVLKIQGENSNPIFTVKPTEFMNYGWGVTNRSMGQTGISSEKDEFGVFSPISFNLVDGHLGNPVPGKPGTYSYSMGDPIEIYASPYISELDLSNFAVNLLVLDFYNMPNKVLGTQLKRLILGKEDRINSGESLKEIGSLDFAEKLEYIDMRGFKDFNSLDISKNLNMKEVYAFNSGLQGISFANGARIERLSLPECYNTLQLHSVNYLTKENIIFENDNKSNLTKIIIDNCNQLKSSSFDFIKEWYQQRNGEFAGCIVEMSGIDWRLPYAELDVIETLKEQCSTFSLRGTITITDKIEGVDRNQTRERVARIKSLFGDNCFLVEENPPVVVTCTVPFVIINASATEVTANKDTVVNYTCEVYPSINPNSPSIEYRILSGATYGSRTGVTITNDFASRSARLTTQELVTGSNDNLTIRVTYQYLGSNEFTSEINLLVKDPTYPVSVNNIVLNGPTSLKENGEYDYSLTVNDRNGVPVTGSYDVTWSFSKIASEYIDYDESGIVDGDENYYRVITTDREPATSFEVTLNAQISCENGYTVTKGIDLLILNRDVVLTIQSNPVVMSVCNLCGWAADENVLMKEEAMAIENIGTAFSGLTSDAFAFNELAEFENLTTIPDGAFCGCNITAITIPSGVTYLGARAFEDCDALATVTFNNVTGINNIPERCFYNCHSLNKIVLPETITSISQFAFGGTNSLKKLAVNGGNRELGIIVVPNTLTSIADGAFETYSVAIVDRVPVTSITGPNASIEIIEIPDSIGAIADGNFDRYLIRGSKVESFAASENNPRYSTPDGVLYNLQKQTIYKYPCNKTDLTEYTPDLGCLVLYEFSFYGTKLSTVRTGDAVREMGEHQFERSNVVTVDLSRSSDLTKITHYAFSNCANLTTIIYPPALTTIGTRVFEYNSSLTEINIPNTVTTVYQNVISNCHAITELRFPDSITTVYNLAETSTIGTNMVQTCNSLRYLKLPKYLSVGTNVADSNANLTGVTLPVASYYDSNNNNVVVNGSSYYRYFLIGANSSNLMDYYLPEEDNGLTFFANGGILYKPVSGGIEISNVPLARTEITLGPEVTSVGPECCRQCRRLTAFTMTDSVTNIGETAFYQCNALKSIVIPDSVTSVGSQIFYQCTSLETAVVGRNVNTITDRMFSNCTNLKNVVVKSKNLSLIEIIAFDSCVNLSSITICSLSVPGFSDVVRNTNMSYGKHPFGQVDNYPWADKTFTRTPSTFVGRNVSGSKKLRVAYFMSGSDTSIDAYRSEPLWRDPLFTPVSGGDISVQVTTAGTYETKHVDSGCGFEMEYLTFSDDIYIKVLDRNGDEYSYDGQDTTQIPYADETAIGVYQSTGSYAGYYKFSLGTNIVSDKPITITMGPSGDFIGSIRPSAYESHVYTIQIGVAGSVAGRGTKLFAATNSLNTESDTVSKYDYDRLVSRLNSLEMKLKNMEESD